jgi:hypothetical protein
MGKAAIAKAFADINAAVAVLNAEAAGCGSEPFSVADPLSGLADGCLDILAGAARVQARVSGVVANAAGTYADIARAAAPPDVPVQAQEMAIAAEISCVMAIGDRAAGALLAQSHALTTSLPRTLAALHNGTISWQHAKVMVDETAALDPAGAAALEAYFLDPDTPKPGAAAAVGEMPAYRFKVKARTWRERHHAESIEKRHAKGIADRRVEYRPDQDGMAYISGYLPADQANAVWNRITAIARGLQGPHEDRTLTQLRADTFATALLSSGTSRRKRSRPRPLAPRPGPRHRPGVVTDGPDGRAGDAGRVRADPAVDGTEPRREGAASFYRVLVDPRDGAPLEIGRTSYRVSKAMRNWLRLRDGKCPFPGCNNNSLDNEADHILAWHQGGTTGISNLGQPCPKHHRLRHTSGWKPTPATKTAPPGWTSPTGRHYKSEHQDWEPPHWPNQPQAVSGEPPDFVYIGISPGEESLERFLHAPPA